MNRRRFIQLTSAGTILLTHTRLGAELSISMRTYTYKTVSDLKIQADVYRIDDARKRPVIVWLHGGALINGGRQGISSRVKQIASELGCVLVSFDYRLAPETKLPEIIKDVEDAFTWLHREGPKQFHADTTKVVVTGGSAGGYLTLITGYRAKPRPTALVSLWGYGDLIGDWYSKPSPHPRHQQSKLSTAEALQQVHGRAIANAKDRSGNGGAFYQYCRQHGVWPNHVSGWNPQKEPEKFYPFMPVKNVSQDYPPTLLIHGTRDTDVPYEQSVMMAQQLEKHGVEHRLISIADGEHGLVGGDPKKIEAAYQATKNFIAHYINSPD